MSPFPFGPTPRLTFRQFADRLEQLGCRVTRISIEDNEALYQFTRHADNGTEIDVIQHVEDETWELTPSLFRNLCARLDINSDFFFDGPIH